MNCELWHYLKTPYMQLQNSPHNRVIFRNMYLCIEKNTESVPSIFLKSKTSSYRHGKRRDQYKSRHSFTMESCKFAQPFCGLLHLAVWIQYIQTDLIYADPDIYEGKKLIGVFVLLFFHTYYVESLVSSGDRGIFMYFCIFQKAERVWCK